MARRDGRRRARHLDRVTAAFAGALVALLLSACGGGDDELERSVPTAGPPTSPTSPMSPTSGTGGSAATGTTAGPAGPPAIRAVKVAEFDGGALALAVRRGEDTIYVAEKSGRVKALRGTAVDPVPVLDLSGKVSTGPEQGLLGLVFSPAGDRLYVDYTDPAGDTHVVEYAFAGGRADPASRRELLSVNQPFANHNGGQVLFGPDGFLYIGLGDGGSGGDPHGNAQRLDTLLGKILRIDPRPDGGRPYTIPPGNPFASRSGARPEIWAYGLRNPWRFTFDRQTGALWIGDVGQSSVEEVDAVEAPAGGGQNYGWNRLEGTRHFSGTAPAGAVAPVHEYPNGGGNCSVTGGYVYRGSLIPGLRGSYVFADFCKGELQALMPESAGSRRSVALDVTVDSVASFGEDAAGDLYVLSLSTGLYRLEPAS